MITMVRHNRSVLITLMLLTAIWASAAVWQQRANTWLIETSRSAGIILSDLRITGLNRTKRNNILAVLDIDEGMPLLSVDLAALQQRIEALPWIKRADITRILPGGLQIVITECEPYALVQADGQVSLIDADGKYITDRGLTEFAAYPLLVGAITPSELRYFNTLKITAGDVATQIKSAVRVSGRRWDVIFDNGVRVKLPEDMAHDYNALQAWQKFIDLNHAHNLLAREVSVVDMRTPDRLIVRVTPEGQRQMAGKEKAL